MVEEQAQESVETPAEETAVESESLETTDVSETPKTIAEEVSDVLGEGETLDSLEGDASPETTTETVEDFDVNSEVESILDEHHGTQSGEQKRINKLTSEKYQLKDEIADLRRQIETTKSQPELSTLSDLEKPEYTDQQLDKAFSKVTEDYQNDGNIDFDLLNQIWDHKLKNVKYDLANRYQQEKEHAVVAQKRQAEEWNTIVETYDYLSGEDEPELYEGAKKELNIRDSNSLLYQLALALFSQKEDEEAAKRYKKPGGQQLAVSDAVKIILKRRNKKITKGKDGVKLERRLAKAKRAQSLGSITSDKQDAPAKSSRPKTKRDELNDYIKDRKSVKNKAMGL